MPTDGIFVPSLTVKYGILAAIFFCFLEQWLSKEIQIRDNGSCSRGVIKWWSAAGKAGYMRNITKDSVRKTAVQMAGVS